jgi:very-short-patch-repair endonuclease
MLINVEEDNTYNTPALNSPPLEGCPKGGVVKNIPQSGVSTSEILININNNQIFSNVKTNLPYNPKLKPLLKDKRKAGILSEVIFWQQVHKRKFHAIDFDRQRIIGNFIVDFYVKTLGLVIEIDGSSHDNKQEYDAERQLYLENLGLKVYCILDGDVKKNIERVMLDLEKYIVEQFGAKE